jgi:hypothetical protein
MEVQYEIPVIVDGRPEKHKTERLVLASVPVTVDLEECSRAELTPAVSVRFQMNDATRCDYMSHGGRLYLALEPVAMLKRTIPLYELQNVPFVFKRISYFVERAAEKECAQPRPTIYPPTHRHTIKRNRSLTTTPLADMAFETLDSPSLEQQIAVFQRRASRLLICDGMIHVEVSEPCISVKRAMNDGNVYLVRPLHRPFFGLSKERGFPDALFRIDENEKARDFCLSLGASNEPLLNFHKFLVDVYDPSVLNLSSERASCYAAAGNLCRSVGGTIDPPLDTELKALASLMDGHTEASCPDELCDAFAALLDVHRSGADGFKYDANIAGAVADMWDNREISFTSPAHSANGGSRP